MLALISEKSDLETRKAVQKLIGAGGDFDINYGDYGDMIYRRGDILHIEVSECGQCYMRKFDLNYY